MISRTLSITGWLCLSSALWLTTYSQTPTEKAVLLQNLQQKPTKITYQQATNNQNEVQVVFAGLFLAYKNFISSQDLQRCTFHPSCSEYGMIAVKQLGAVRGMLSTFDRLTRCNGFSPEKYQIDYDRKLLLDDVDEKKQTR